MKPLSCDSFYRGCNLDDIEDVMDMYTGETNAGLERETRKKNPEHVRRLRRTAQDMMPRYGVQPIDECADGVSTPETFDASAMASPALYDGMSTVDMPYKPYDRPDIARNSAVYDNIRYEGGGGDEEEGVPRRSTASFRKEDVDDTATEAVSIAASERTDDEEDDDDENARRRARKTAMMSSSARNEAQPPSRGRSRKSSSPRACTTYAMELALYIASGVFLIFVMEQFVQIGIAIGRSSAATF